MGSGASSVSLSEQQEVALYRELRAEYEKSHKMGVEDEKEIYERLRQRFEELTRGEGSAHAEAKGGESNISRGTSFERRTSSTNAPIRIGDVVRCKLRDDESLFYEGVVLEDYYDGTYLVDFGVDQSNEVVHLLKMQKVLSWDELELKDHVQVKDQDSNLYSSAIVVGLHSNKTYDVAYEGCDEIEKRVEASRIRKVRSNRSKAVLRWRLLANSFKAISRTGSGKKTGLISAEANRP